MKIKNLIASFQTVNSDEMLEALQNFFKGINSIKWHEAMDLVALYSTVDMLKANGLDRESVLVVKKAIRAKMMQLSNCSPALVSDAVEALESLMKEDEDFIKDTITPHEVV